LNAHGLCVSRPCEQEGILSKSSKTGPTFECRLYLGHRETSLVLAQWNSWPGEPQPVQEYHVSLRQTSMLNFHQGKWCWNRRSCRGIHFSPLDLSSPWLVVLQEASPVKVCVHKSCKKGFITETVATERSDSTGEKGPCWFQGLKITSIWKVMDRTKYQKRPVACGRGMKRAGAELRGWAPRTMMCAKYDLGLGFSCFIKVFSIFWIWSACHKLSAAM
jgi:hypothetical protein